jgi:hypothetical protein
LTARPSYSSASGDFCFWSACAPPSLPLIRFLLAIEIARAESSLSPDPPSPPPACISRRLCHVRSRLPRRRLSPLPPSRTVPAPLPTSCRLPCAFAACISRPGAAAGKREGCQPSPCSGPPLPIPSSIDGWGSSSYGMESSCLLWSATSSASASYFATQRTSNRLLQLLLPLPLQFAPSLGWNI